MIGWQILTLIAGFILGYIFYELFNYRAGGVLVIPLMVIYTIEYPLMLVFILLTTLFSFLIVHLIHSKILIYGRRVLYLSLLIGVFTNLALELILKLNVIELSWYPLVLPGLFAYNLHREYNSKNSFPLSICLTIGLYCILGMIALVGVYLL